MDKNTFKEDIFPILFLTIVVCIAVVALTATNGFTEKLIEDNKNEAIKENLAVLFPEMDDLQVNETIGVYTILKEGNTIGYAFEAVGQGYGGDISIMVGLENTSMAEDDIIVVGITIIDAAGETPGLGQLITEESFLEQFVGVNANDMMLSKNGGQIDAISGATISSSAVVDAIHDTMLAKAELIRELLEGGI